MGQILCGGEQVDVPDLAVQTWRYQPKLGFPRLKARRETRAVCLHWTGGTGRHEQVYRTLVERNCSVHFVIDPDGSVFQHCDTFTLAAHCKGANPFSIGIEIVNPATEVSKETPPRALTREVIHGVDQVRTAFYPAQVKAALALTAALCTQYMLPMRVPMAGADVLATVLTPGQLAEWTGVLGHLHVNRQKADCGLMLLRAVAAHSLRGRDGSAQ
jgi:N-acetyl-anhydromuramyl-L-alanine amidase AmpD